MKTYTETRKADRHAMAKELAAIAQEYGAQFRTEENGKTLDIYITTHRGLAVHIDFEGGARSNPDVYCTPWHFDGSTDACLSDEFGRTAGGSVNQFHWHKCTAFTYGWVQLRDTLATCLYMAQEGSAFDAERERLSIIKNGTAAARNAKWAEYRAEMEAERPRYILKNRSVTATHNEYVLYNAAWSVVRTTQCTPAGAEALQLESVSPMQVYNATSGKMSA